jgi:hypothetical protein
VLKVITGFCTLDRVPLLNSQFQAVGLPVDRSVNETVRGAQPEVTLAVKLATGFCPKAVADPVKAKARAIRVLMQVL